MVARSASFAVPSKGRRQGVLLLCLSVVVAWAQPASVIAADREDVAAKRQVWMDRLLAQLDELSANDRVMLVATLADAGQPERAKALVRQKLPESLRAPASTLIAAAQSARGDLPGALQTLDGLPKDNPTRDYGTSFVAIRRAQRGNVADAQRLIEGVKDQHHRDRARSVIAKAQAQAGDQNAAAATADLIQDRYYQGEARKAIAAARTGEVFSAEQIPSPFLCSTITAFSLFSSDSAWKTHAFATLGAACRKDSKALHANAEKAMAELKGLPKGLERTTGYAILVVAFCEAGENAKAESAGNEALAAMSGDILGVSSRFGRPIVIYAMLRLGHYEVIDRILERTAQEQDGLSKTDESLVLQAIAAALLEKQEDGRLEKVYQRLRTPRDRAELAIGAIGALTPPPKGRAAASRK